MDYKDLFQRVVSSVVMAGCEPVMEEILNIIEEKDRQTHNLSNSLNECKNELAYAKKFIQKMKETYEGRRSDVADLCNTFLTGEEVDFGNAELRYAKCVVPVEAEGFHFSIPITYDSLTTLFSFEETEGIQTEITEVAYFD